MPTAPHRTKRPEPIDLSHAKLAILLAAERLFADRGIEAVSLREIALSARHGNNNAVQYHFKSKEGLVQALFQHRVKQMDAVRQPLLAAAEAKGQLSDMRTLLEILCLPLLDLVDGYGRHTYAAFMNQYLTRYRPAGIPHPVDAASEQSSALGRLLTLIGQRISYVPRHHADLRIALGYLMFTNMLVRHDSDAAGSAQAGELSDLVHDTLEMMTVTVSTPYRGPASR